MIIDLRGCTLAGAILELTKDCKIYNARLVNCVIDDVEAVRPWADNCQFENCTLRSAAEAEKFFSYKEFKL
jgi:hypothetical protein